MKWCDWQQTEDGQWETDCGQVFEVIDGKPSENKMNFCCFCGGAINEKQFTEAEDEEQ